MKAEDRTFRRDTWSARRVSQGGGRGCDHVEDVPLRWSRDLHVAPVIAVWNKRRSAGPGRAYLPRDDSCSSTRIAFITSWGARMNGKGEHSCTSVCRSRCRSPTRIANIRPPLRDFLIWLRQHAGVHIDIEKPLRWDVPAWLAAGEADYRGHRQQPHVPQPDVSGGSVGQTARRGAPSGSLGERLLVAGAVLQDPELRAADRPQHREANAE